jgi:hypothetical protein
MVGMAGFFWIWAANAAPLANIAQGVCNVSNSLGIQFTGTCERIAANEEIIQSGPIIAVAVGFFGIIAIIYGIVQMVYSRRKK